MICKHCGKENEEGSKFCMWCGQIFEEPKNSAKVQPAKISTQSVKNNSDGDSQSRKVSAQPKMSDTNMHNGQNAYGNQNQAYQSQGQNMHVNQNQSYQPKGLGTGNTSQGQNGYYDPNAAYQQPYRYNDPYGTQSGMNQNMNPNMMTQSPQIHTIIPDYDPSLDYTPLSMWGYFGYNLLFAIPLIGWIFLLITALGGLSNNVNLRNYARSFFCVLLIVGCIFLLMIALSVFTVISLNS